jgi:MoxR-like ATPases
MPLTQEQSEILNFVQPQNCNGLSHVLLHAYAGSGKSFILREIAKRLPGPASIWPLTGPLSPTFKKRCQRILRP